MTDFTRDVDPVDDNVRYLRPGDQDELGCAGCAQLKNQIRENERNHADALRFLKDENLGLIDINATMARRISHLKAERSQALKVADDSDDVEALMSAWRTLCRKGDERVKIPLDGKRAQFTRKARGWFDDDTLLEAIHGIALYPYDAGYGERSATGTQKQRRDDLVYLFADEERVDKFCKLAQRAWLMAIANQRDAMRIADETWATAMRWFDLTHYIPFFPEARGIVDLQRRIDEYADEWQRDRDAADARIEAGRTRKAAA